VRDSVTRGTRLVIAGGGDGTLNAVANGVAEAGEEVTVAVLPLGTGNDFSRTLAIPANPAAALALIEEPRVRNIDLVKAESASGSRYFVNMAGAGNSRSVSEHLTEEIKRRWGPFCYVRGVIDVLAELERYHATIRFDDGADETFDVFNIFLANGRTCGGGLTVAPTADPEDGLLDVIIVLDGGPIDIAALAARFLVSNLLEGSFLDSDMVVHRTAHRVWIDSRPPMTYVTDGDARIEGAATFTTVPGALRMVVGPEYRSRPGEDERSSKRAGNLEISDLRGPKIGER
jgi:diacylglycerol kinase (ATP)